MTIKGMIMGDSPKTHTGFAQVVGQFAQACHEADMDITVLGFLDHERDAEGKLPYKFLPVPHLDDLAHSTFGNKVSMIKPDFLLIVTDPGNLNIYLYYMLKRKMGWFKYDGHDAHPTVISYTPIEGWPVRSKHAEAIGLVQELGGTPVVYHEQAKEILQAQYPFIKPEVVHHGLDHAEFTRYSDGDRKILRELAGLDDFFLIGTGGVNKRTKGFPEVIYVANEMNKMGMLEKHNIRFYLHTSMTPVMYGHHLDDLIEYYKLEKYFLKRMNFDNLSYWLGVMRSNNTLEQARQLAGMIPDTPQGRGLMWMGYDFVSMMNCFDMFLCLSQVEGWGFWPGEAMKCGVPTAIVRDLGIRDAVYGDGRYPLSSLPYRMWDTWESGARLVKIDPYQVACELDEFIWGLKSFPDYRNGMSDKAIECASRYKWADANAKMVKIIQETVERTKAMNERELQAIKDFDLRSDHGTTGPNEGVLGTPA